MEQNPTKKCSQCYTEIPAKAKKCPNCQSDLRNGFARHPIISFIILVPILIGFLSNIGSDSPEPAPVTPTKTQVQEVKMAFDVPSLVGKSLVELETALGTPDENSEPADTYIQFSDIRTWEKTWKKDGYLLMVTYNIDTNRVMDLFLGTDTDASLVVFRKTENILKVGNLRTDSDQYSVEFVKLKAILGKPKSETPDGYTGAIIKAK